MRINLSGADAAVAQQLLESQNVHIAGLIHQRCGSVAKLVDREVLEPRRPHGPFDELFHAAVGDAVFPPPGDEDSPLLGVHSLHRVPLGKVKPQSFYAGIVEINHSLLVALAEKPDLPLFEVDIAQIHAHKLRKPHPTVQKQHDHAVIPFREIALVLGAFQQVHGLLCRQIFG